MRIQENHILNGKRKERKNARDVFIGLKENVIMMSHATIMNITRRKKEMKLPRFKCLRCEHEWIPRTENKPTICPSCKSPYWSIERKNGVNKNESKTD